MIKENKKTPEIRFPGFTEDWEQRKLGELVISHNAGIYISKEDYGTGTNVIGVGNIYDNDIFDGEIYRLGPVNDEKFLLEENDLIYGESSLVPEGIARTVCVGKNGVGSAFAWHTRRVKVDQSVINSHFATLELNYNIDVRKYLISVSTQTALTGMTTEGYFGVTLSLPTVEEQAHISSLFKQLDNLITLHQRKCDSLKKLKKGMLQKMFPKKDSFVPEIRFPGFTEPWEQRKFEEFVVNVAKRNRDNLDLEPYAVTNDRGFIAQKDAHDDFGYMNNVDRTAYNIVPPNSFAYNPARINVGSLGYYSGTENVIVSSLYEVFQTKDYIDDRFLWHWFKSDIFPKWIDRLQEGSVRLYFYFDKLVQCQMMLPSVEEQKKIGAYLDELDNLITLHQRKCDSLKKLKKSMLQKMFV